MRLYAIDPGVHKSWCSRFERGRLVSVFYLHSTTMPDKLQDADLVLWERPQVDARTRVSVPAIVDLAVEGATIAGIMAGVLGCPIQAVTPSTWKGSVPKPLHHARLIQALNRSEVAILPEGSQDRIRAACAAMRNRPGRPGATYYGSWDGHNALDAAGLGAWKVGRL
jgi:hypothetical protein